MQQPIALSLSIVHDTVLPWVATMHTSIGCMHVYMHAHVFYISYRNVIIMHLHIGSLII